MNVITRDQDALHGVFTYELATSSIAPLTIRVCSRVGEPAVTAVDRYRVEARAGDAKNAVTVVACGATRAEALTEVARWWLVQQRALQLPPLDWRVIARVLTAAGAV